MPRLMRYFDPKGAVSRGPLIPASIYITSLTASVSQLYVTWVALLQTNFFTPTFRRSISHSFGIVTAIATRSGKIFSFPALFTARFCCKVPPRVGTHHEGFLIILINVTLEYHLGVIKKVLIHTGWAQVFVVDRNGGPRQLDSPDRIDRVFHASLCVRVKYQAFFQHNLTRIGTFPINTSRTKCLIKWRGDIKYELFPINIIIVKLIEIILKFGVCPFAKEAV
mmetsp:Transcript_2990/g.4253  ORF Transcript_2990/g.4253 Transcript_2990/m.4253 type:complete len:223 (-) Transcript_2990:2202-2870(-)